MKEYLPAAIRELDDINTHLPTPLRSLDVDTVPYTPQHSSSVTPDSLVPGRYHDLLCPGHIPGDWLLATFPHSTAVL